MTTQENDTYKLPQFANLSGIIAMLGVSSFICSIISILWTRENNYIPFAFISLSFSSFMLGATGVKISSREYIAEMQKNGSLQLGNIKLELFLLLGPIVFIYLDENIIRNNIPYITFFFLFYFIVFCHTSLLIWYRKKFSY